MTTCVICGEYYRLNSWHNNRTTCQNCVDNEFPSGVLVPLYADSEYMLEKDKLLNPSGRTKAVYYDDYDMEDSHGF
jgi:hypothetical protein